MSERGNKKDKLYVIPFLRISIEFEGYSLYYLQDLRRKLPVTRTLFPWNNTLQFSLTRDISKELGIGK